MIDSGWRVDFNLGLSSFEPNVAGVRNLINFVLETKLPVPPRFIFVSTVAVIAREFVQSLLTGLSVLKAVIVTKVAGLIPEGPATPESATINGYSQSKWVAERVLEVAAEQTSLTPVIVRVGQVSGGANGCWKPLEWIPGIVQSAALANSLPSLGKAISLLPLQTCAQALTQLLETGMMSPPLHLHLANPTLSEWDYVFNHISRELNVPLLPYPEWLSKLKQASVVVKPRREHSVLRLLEFYEGLNKGNGLEAAGLSPCSTEVARSVCPVLNGEGLRTVEVDEIKRWLDYWMSLGLLDL
jgi:thioester reductase-like protein